MADPEPEPRKPLRQRPARSPIMHWAVDSAVAALVLLVPATFLGFSLLTIVVTAMVVGALVAPWTLKREAEALARRPPPDEMID